MNPDSVAATHSPPVPPMQPQARGGTLLLVEDSRVTADYVRLLFRGAAGRLRRADSLRSARRHISLYTPDAVIIDLGLPDGSGLDLIAEMARRRPRAGLIVATSGDAEMEEDAFLAGADRFLPKPFGTGALFCQMLAPVFFGLRGGAQPDQSPTQAALRDDLYLALDLLNGKGAQPAYARQFIAQLACMTGDPALSQAVRDGQRSEISTLLRHRLRALPLI
ncbi:response regulator [Roseibaca sp. Y0-43]|uniref:response regulator n=1 Tax=Roseibaca sp. Y0-43 TaxID=2816854 RepID=UPI001D0C8C4A|nr:response regulator [Roseibaca sp. Y0-43]MCC1480936.1 response regulator [Roseibaca sp. Y0-43]